MQVARRSTWLVPLAIILVIVLLQLIRPACGSARLERSYRSPETESSQLQENVEDEDTEEESHRDRMVEPLTSRVKRSRGGSISRRHKAALMSLTLVGAATVFITAGYLVYHYRLPEKILPSTPSATEAAPATTPVKVGPDAAMADKANNKELGDKASTYLQLGKKYIPPAVAVGLAAAAAAWVQFYGSPFGSIMSNSTTQ